MSHDHVARSEHEIAGDKVAAEHAALVQDIILRYSNFQVEKAVDGRDLNIWHPAAGFVGWVSFFRVAVDSRSWDSRVVIYLVAGRERKLRRRKGEHRDHYMKRIADSVWSAVVASGEDYRWR